MAKGYSKQVSDRAKASRALAQTIETNAAAIAEGVKAALGTKGAKAPDVGPLLAALASLVTVRSDALAAADQAHELEMADDQAPREARDAATEKGRETLVDLRAALAGAYGNASLPKVGLTGPAPQDPQALLAYGRKVNESLAQVKLGAPKRKGVQVDLKVFGKELDTQLAALESALKAVARETREGQATQAAKAKALDENDKAFLRAGTVVEALARLAGLDEVADRARPSARSPGLRENDEPEPEPAPEPA
jgi:hypothetical protein